MKISRSSNIPKGGNEARLKEEGGGGGRGGKKGWPYRCLLPPADTQALRDFTLGGEQWGKRTKGSGYMYTYG